MYRTPASTPEARVDGGEASMSSAPTGTAA
jgi:hypothetical protein